MLSSFKPPFLSTDSHEEPEEKAEVFSSTITEKFLEEAEKI
jgi:hypothetical protein